MHSDRNFLQSDSWADFQRKLGLEVVTQKQKKWQFIGIVEKADGPAGKFIKRLYAPYGPFADDLGSLALALESFEATGKKYGVDFLRVEPDLRVSSDVSELLIKRGYAQNPRPFNPPLTSVVNLKQPFDEILKKMSKTNSYLWRKAENNGLSFSVSYKSADCSPFLEMMKETANRAGAIFHKDEYYKLLLDTLSPSKVAGLAYAYRGGKPVVGALFVDDKESKTRLYMHAGGYVESRKLSANSPLLTYLIKDAKDKGLEKFDMFGVSPAEDESHRWAGISKFKRSFGGEDLQYAGTWEKPLNPLKFGLLKFARKTAKTIHNIKPKRN